MSMFCYQCEETAKGTGCVKVGVCGKDETTAALQDVLTHLTKGIGIALSKMMKPSSAEAMIFLRITADGIVKRTRTKASCARANRTSPLAMAARK